jgi:hypothetical protein
MKTKFLLATALLVVGLSADARAQQCPSSATSAGCMGPFGPGSAPHLRQQITGPYIRPANINPATGRPYDATNYDQRYDAVVTKQQMRNRRKLEGVTR